jgi:uncharacterized membrane protein
MTGGISTGKLVGLMSVSLALMLIWRNFASMRLRPRQVFGMALIWGVIFVLLAIIAGQYGA